MLTLYRTPIVLGSNPGARVCFVEVVRKEDDLSDGLITPVERVLGTWPAIENADDPDKMPVGSYELVMTRMSKSQRPALWLPDTELFVHGLASGENFEAAKISDARVGTPDMLKGCPMPGIQLSYRGGVLGPDRAMVQVFKALGGWVEGKRVPFRCVELGELPATRCENDLAHAAVIANLRTFFRSADDAEPEGHVVTDFGPVDHSRLYALLAQDPEAVHALISVGASLADREARYEVTEICVDAEINWRDVSRPGEGERWTGLPDDGVLVERVVK